MQHRTGRTISEMPPADSIGPNDLILIVQNGEDKRATVAQIAAAIRNIKPA